MVSRASKAKVAALLVSVVVMGVAPAAPAACEGAAPDPGVTAPGRAILGFPDRRATTDEIGRFVALMDAQSDRVRSGTFARSWRGTPLTYALVSSERNLANVDRIAAAHQQLRDPRVTSRAEAERIAARLPAIVWYTGNVHGQETSGADAALEILYELAAGRDCTIEEMLADLVVGIIPTQNPDGRDALSRENAYGFDMNRDWFASTQPETDGKLSLLSRYPPVLFIDAHEMGSSGFFFPPNADPIHHEISSESLHWINDLYGPALAAAFDERRSRDPLNWQYFNYDIYDLFYMGYGDTVPTTAFTAAGMTFEKGAADTDRQRETEQFVAGWTAIRTAAKDRARILRDYHTAHRTALAEGRAGILEPNHVLQPQNKLQRTVPNITVRNYFIDPRTAKTDATRLVARLMRMGVEVSRLDGDLVVPDLRRMGRSPSPATIPAGSYWIPMEQPQKRWIQALLGEDSYVPFPYFYDVTSWSNPLLMNVSAGASGARLAPRATPLRAPPVGRVTGAEGASYFWFQGETGYDVAGALALARAGRDVRRLEQATEADGRTLPRGAFVVRDVATASIEEIAARFSIDVVGGVGSPPSGAAITAPRIALYAPLTQSASSALNEESFGHMRWLLERAWDLPIDVIGGADIAAGALTARRFDVLIVPGVATDELALARSEIRSWIDAGGTYVGTARPGGTGGTPFAVAGGFTTAQLSQPQGMQIPGSQVRVELSPDTPLAAGAPPFAYWYHLGEDLLSPTTTGRTIGVYPSKDPAFWISGYAAGADALRGSAALVEETLGSGRVILFSGEPNFRGFTDGVSFFLANALAYPEGALAAGIDVASPEAAAAVAAAVATAHPATGPGRPLQIEVAAEDAADAQRVLSMFTGAASRTLRRGSAWFTVANPLGLTVEEHPFAWRLLRAFREAGIPLRSAVL